MNAYSKDLRVRVLAAVDRGKPRVQLVRVFGVSLATIGRWLRHRREAGEVAPRPSPGRTPSILRNAEERRSLWHQLQGHRELSERKRGTRVSVSTMSRAIGRLGWTYKQRRWEPSSVTNRSGAPGGRG